MSGASCARILKDCGYSVTIFEKSRGFGGRMATRIGAQCSFDHGAQYFTCQSAEFKRVVKDWLALGIVDYWNGRLVSWDGKDYTEHLNQDMRLVGVPAMTEPVRYMCRDVKVNLNHRVSSILREGENWAVTGLTISNETFKSNGFDHIVLAIPPRQALSILGEYQQLDHLKILDSITMQAVWAAMLAFDKPLEITWDGCFDNEGPLSWISRNSSKVGRGSENLRAIDSWILHAHTESSQKMLAASKDDMRHWFLEKAGKHFKSMPEPIEIMTHKWLYALPLSVLNQSFVIDHRFKIGVCGDWCNGPKVEGAFLSGYHLGQTIASYREGR